VYILTASYTDSKLVNEPASLAQQLTKSPNGNKLNESMVTGPRLVWPSRAFYCVTCAVYSNNNCSIYIVLYTGRLCPVLADQGCLTSKSASSLESVSSVKDVGVFSVHGEISLSIAAASGLSTACLRFA